MLSKIGGIFGSVRFWLVTFAAASVYSGILQSQGFDWKTLFDTLAGWLATVAGIGTVDKFAQALATKKTDESIVPNA